MSLSGCATAQVSGSCVTLSLPQWERSEQVIIADEINGASFSAHWPVVIGDYIALRDQVRACKGVASK